MRTAYQGKLFEFTTTAVRKPEMTNLAQLKSINSTIYVQEGATQSVNEFSEDIG
jgi:hypothetical protein